MRHIYFRPERRAAVINHHSADQTPKIRFTCQCLNCWIRSLNTGPLLDSDVTSRPLRLLDLTKPSSGESQIDSQQENTPIDRAGGLKVTVFSFPPPDGNFW